MCVFFECSKYIFFSTELRRLFMGEIELDGAVVSPAARHEFDSAVALRDLFDRR